MTTNIIFLHDRRIDQGHVVYGTDLTQVWSSVFAWISKQTQDSHHVAKSRYAPVFSYSFDFQTHLETHFITYELFQDPEELQFPIEFEINGQTHLCADVDLHTGQHQIYMDNITIVSTDLPEKPCEEP